MLVEAAQELAVSSDPDAKREERKEDAEENDDDLVIVAHLRDPEDVHHNDEARIRGEAHPVLVESVASGVHAIPHRVQRDHGAPEARPVGERQEIKEAPLELLNENVADHRVILTHFKAKKALIMQVSLLADLELGPKVESILSQED